MAALLMASNNDNGGENGSVSMSKMKMASVAKYQRINGVAININQASLQ
jgi:hypothetical protein